MFCHYLWTRPFRIGFSIYQVHTCHIFVRSPCSEKSVLEPLKNPRSKSRQNLLCGLCCTVNFSVWREETAITLRLIRFSIIADDGRPKNAMECTVPLGQWSWGVGGCPSWDLFHVGQSFWSDGRSKGHVGVFDGLMEEMRGLRETLERGPGRVPARHYSRFASQSTGVWAKIDLEAQVPPQRR